MTTLLSRWERLTSCLKQLYEQDPPDTQLVNILTDLRHYADRYGLDFWSADRMAVQHYRQEWAAQHVVRPPSRTLARPPRRRVRR
jgi:hypothetical protein